MTSIEIGAARSLIEDEKNNIWVGATNGLFILDASRETLKKIHPENEESVDFTSTEIRTIYLDNAKKVLWIGSFNTGLSKLDLATQTIVKYPYNSPNNSGLNHFNITSLYQSDEGYLWIGTEGGGLSIFDPDSLTFELFLAEEGSSSKLSSNAVNSILEMNNGILVVATEWGLNLFDKDSRTFKQYFSDVSHRESLSSNNIQSLFLDVNGDLWLGYFPSSVGFLNASSLAFRTYRANPNNPNSLKVSPVLSVHESPDNILWLGTDGGGLNKFNLNTNNFTHYHKGTHSNSVDLNAVLDIADYKNGQLILGTWNDGLAIFDPTSEKLVEKYLPTADDSNTLSNSNTWSVLFDNDSNIYIGTIGGGLDVLSVETHNFTHHVKTSGPDEAYIIWKVFKDSKGLIWLGSEKGLGILNSQTGLIDMLSIKDQKGLNITTDIVIDITEDNVGNLWVATRYNGLYFYNRESKTFTSFDESDGLPSNKLKSLVFDDKGMLWVGTDRGLARLNTQTRTVATYTSKSGLQGNVFNFGTALLTSNN